MYRSNNSSNINESYGVWYIWHCTPYNSTVLFVQLMSTSQQSFHFPFCHIFLRISKTKTQSLSQKAVLDFIYLPALHAFAHILKYFKLDSNEWFHLFFHWKNRQFRRSKLWQVAVNLQSPAALRGTVSLHYSLSVSFHISFLVNFLYQISSKKLISTSVDISSNSFNYQPLSYRTSTKYLSSASGSLLRSKQPGRSMTNWSTLLSCKPPKHDWNWCRKSFTVRYGVQKSEQYIV